MLLEKKLHKKKSLTKKIHVNKKLKEKPKMNSSKKKLKNKKNKCQMISKKLLIRSEILFMIQFQSVMMKKIIKYKEHGEPSQK